MFLGTWQKKWNNVAEKLIHTYIHIFNWKSKTPQGVAGIFDKVHATVDSEETFKEIMEHNNI